MIKKLLTRLTVLVAAAVACFALFSLSACGDKQNDLNDASDGGTLNGNGGENDQDGQNGDGQNGENDGDNDGENDSDQDGENNGDQDGGQTFGEWQYFTYDYTDTEGNAATMEYGLFIPASYDGGTAYPLLTYIPDARYKASSLVKIAEAEGPAAWLTEEKMQSDPVIWLIMRISDTSPDLSVEGSQVAQIVPVIDKVIGEFNVDEDRLYLTGHSMGGIMFFAVNDAYPDKFAATVYVACQPGESVHDELYDAIMERGVVAEQKFVYISSRLDDKAPYGQDDICAILDEKGVGYGLLYGFLPEDEDLNEKIKAVLDEGYAQNFFGFETVKSLGRTEHVYSFAPSYAIDSIYEWLLAQRL